MTQRFDAIIVGAGQAGPPLAGRLTAAGQTVAVVERKLVGGTCVNYGCIPTKTLLRTAEVLQLAREAKDYGVMVADVRLDWAAAQKRKDAIVRRLTGGVSALLQKAGVAVVAGEARLVSPRVIEVAGQSASETITAAKVIIATGSRPAPLPIPGLDGPDVLTSDGALALDALPESLLIIGAGPIGLSAIMGARLYSPAHVVAIDLADSRLEAAKQFGADIVVNNGREDPLAIVRDLTGGLGADVAIEAVGVPPTFELATQLARPGGHIANIGVHGEPATLHLEELWIRNVTITTGLVDTYSTPTLLRLTQGGQVDAGRFITHHFTLDQFEEAYDVFGRAADTGALKVVLTPA